ncbi:MAG: nucleotidyltransferase domain-containing protein [Candidatus Methanoplasma sp.]|jgi:predicted nucleotidyltransferase|nr:nucleotidyltransferase domain-containing protein [Candidatus Methanoplasma sp.]
MEQVGKMRNLTFEELCDIVVPIAVKHGMIRVYLFGSRARGDYNDNSDFDFCILAPKGYGLFKIGSFRCDLEDALGTEVDIISEEGIHNESLKEELLRDRRIIFEA